MNSSATPQNPVIFQTKDIDQKIYVREQKGYYQTIRRYLNVILLAVFIVLPFIQYNGHQAILFNVEKQTLTLFPVTLYPHDLLIFGLIFIVAAFALFYVTRLYGRVWCGYTCPQTIWMLMFNWIERRIEGSHNQSKVLDNSSISVEKVLKKTSKHFIWLTLSLLTSLIFMSYFVPANELYADVFNAEVSSLIQGWIIFFMACTYINGGWVKEKMCLHMCPYSRFQSVMFTPKTTLMAYNANRGESRGPRQRNQPKPSNKGDCVDCNLCVQVCPVGIDIRDGLQYECINCGLCADACDSVMSKFNYAKGLIRYAAQKKSDSDWKQHIGYGLIIALFSVSIVAWGLTRDTFEVSVLRDRQVLYRVNSLGQAENTYSLKTLNKSQNSQTYTLSINDSSLFTIKGNTTFTVKPGEHYVNVITIASKKAPENTATTIDLKVTENSSLESTTQASVFYSGDNTWYN